MKIWDIKVMAVRAIALLAFGMAAGCGLIASPQPLSPSQFVRGRPALGPGNGSEPVAQSGGLEYGTVHSPLLPDEYSAQHSAPPPGISPLVRQAIPAPGEGAGAQIVPATNPSTTGPAIVTAPGSTSGYQVVGTVLAKVDNTPIYADKVLATLDRELAAEAQKFDPETFRRAARQDIENKIQELIHNQLEVERANASLNSEAKTQAQLYAQAWRRQEIISAGGSLEVAKQRALDAGSTFDDQVKDQYQNALVQIYYSQRVAPKIQVSAADMRQYYQQHLETDFTRHAEAKFRLIRVDFTRSGGPEQAAKKVDEIIAELKGGTPFEELAGKKNDDDSLMAKGGDAGGWIRKGNYINEKIEDAVWELQPGSFTEKPIQITDDRGGESRTAYYIAELEAKRGGAVQQFDNSTVQKLIQDKLFSQQLGILREKELADLVGQAVIFREPHGLDTAVDMAMQRYPVWASAR